MLSAPMPSYGVASKTDFCLRGEIGGQERVYPLKPGTHQLGSLADNEIVLPANGVSRLHARLELSAIFV